MNLNSPIESIQNSRKTIESVSVKLNGLVSAFFRVGNHEIGSELALYVKMLESTSIDLSAATSGIAYQQVVDSEQARNMVNGIIAEVGLQLPNRSD